MAENTINEFNTLPEQVQLNKEDIETNTANIQRLGNLFDTYHNQIQSLNTKVATNTTNIATNTESIDSIKQSYLLKSDASNTYLTKIYANATYLSKQDYEESINKGDIQFTNQGWTKFKNITDREGQTITLSVPEDLLEHVQVTGTNDLKLQFFYNDHAVFENIYLHPNNSINNLDYIAKAKSTYFTGQAVLTLSTQSTGLFYIVYQEGTSLTLHLITTI